MKKNLGLLGILILLLIATYFFQEKKTEDLFISSMISGRLQKDEIIKLDLPHVSAEKINDQWRSGGELLSHNTFRMIEKKIKEIKEVKAVDGEWKSYFSSPVEFKINGKEWAIGDTSLDKKSFYVSADKKVYLAYIDGGNIELTSNAEELPEIKKKELIGFLSKTKKELIENQLFRYFPDLPMSKAVIHVEGSHQFELNFEDDTTSPPPIKGVEVHSDLKEKFYSLLTQMTIRAIFPATHELKYKKMAELILVGKGDVKRKWELWLKGKDSADAVLIDNLSEQAFLMSGGTLRVFFIGLQDYWDKKVIPAKEFKSFSELELVLTEADKEAKLTLINSEPMTFKVDGYEVEQPKMEVLVSMILNLGQFDQAERVSQLSSTERKQILSESHLQVSTMGQELVLWRKTEELIVVNLTQGFKAHFNVIDENFRGDFQDVLK